jgi:two-component sensor histidine kinase/DNA-binding response OmpR family regulator
MDDKVNVLLVDDQPAKLLANEEILRDLGENLIKAASAREALEFLLKNDVAIVLIDVCMPDLDGFQLAAMIRDHPRFQKTAIIFVSAIQVADIDRLRGYEMGAVDYVPVPVVPAVLRAKVKVFAELYRKTRQLERLNAELERRVADRTAELEASNARLLLSEQGRSLALAAGQMGSWEWDLASGECICDAGQLRIFGIDPGDGRMWIGDIRRLIAADDLAGIEEQIGTAHQQSVQSEVRITRPNGELRTCICAAAATRSARISIVMIDITERKLAEERQLLLAREVDHRARNALAIVQAIVRLSKSSSKEGYVKAVEGRIQALAQAHTLLSESRWQGADVKRLAMEEIAPYCNPDPARIKVEGMPVSLSPERAQGLALVLHELATNSAKYGALSVPEGTLAIRWAVKDGVFMLEWEEAGGPPVSPPSSYGFGTTIMNTSMKHQFGGNVGWDWHPGGLHCTLEIPLAGGDGTARSSVDRSKNVVRLPSGAMKRILLVEDEAMTGIMMRELLGEYGLFIVGPCFSLREALAAAATELDGAFLDLNISGEFVYPVAELLAERGVPFVFVTGYGAESLDPRFGKTPALQKPITRDNLEAQLARMLGVPIQSLARDAPPATHSSYGLRTA